MSTYYLSSGTSKDVTKTTSDWFYVSAGGFVRVSSGGKITSSGSLALYSDGSGVVMSGGEADIAYISSGGFLAVTGGVMKGTRVYSSGRLQVLDNGTASSLDIKSGGTADIYGAYLESASVSSGDLWLGAGQSTTSKSSSYHVYLYTGASVHVVSGARARLTYLEQPSYFFVSSGGTAYETYVSSGVMRVGKATQSEGLKGYASSTEIFSGASMIVENYGSADKNYVNKGATMVVRSGGHASGNEIFPSGSGVVEKDGTATRTTVYAGGSFDVEGSALTNTVSSNGAMYVSTLLSGKSFGL